MRSSANSSIALSNVTNSNRIGRWYIVLSNTELLWTVVVNSKFRVLSCKSLFSRCV